MQTEIILFQKMEFVVVVDEISYHGNTEFDGGNEMIRMKVGTVDSALFYLKQEVDNERVALPLAAAKAVRFHANQIEPSINAGDPNPAVILNILATIVNPALGTITVPFTAINTAIKGRYKCYIEVENLPTSDIFNKFEFDMELWDA